MDETEKRPFLSHDQLAAAAVENRRTLDQARTLLRCCCGEASDAAVVWRRAPEDRHAAVDSRIGGFQYAANAGVEIGSEEIGV